MLFVNAVNVHQGGGRTLLLALLYACPHSQPCVAFVDERLSVPDDLPPHVLLKKVKPTLLARLQAEWRLSRWARDGDEVICFGNLPPIFPSAGHISVFVQNRFLVDRVTLKGFGLRVRVRIRLERLWLRVWAANASQFVVQTQSMFYLLQKHLRAEKPIHILPFVGDAPTYRRGLLPAAQTEDVAFDFIYVASGDPHKNHRRLVFAWVVLAMEGLFPSLCLTLDRERDRELYEWVEWMMERFRLRISNAKATTASEVMRLYRQSGALVFPSTLESFGLPLIEARHAGLPVLASELDFVRDVIDPDQSFDPQSETSIARAVKRYLGVEEISERMLSADEFINIVLSSARIDVGGVGDVIDRDNGAKRG